MSQIINSVSDKAAHIVGGGTAITGFSTAINALPTAFGIIATLAGIALTFITIYYKIKAEERARALFDLERELKIGALQRNRRAGDIDATNN